MQMKARVKARAWKQIPDFPIQLLQVQEWRDWNSPCWNCGHLSPKSHSYLLSALDHCQRFSHQLLVYTTKVGHLRLASVMHIHATCWKRSNAVSKGDRTNFQTLWTRSVLGAGTSYRQLANPPAPSSPQRETLKTDIRVVLLLCHQASTSASLRYSCTWQVPFGMMLGHDCCSRLSQSLVDGKEGCRPFVCTNWAQWLASKRCSPNTTFLSSFKMLLKYLDDTLAVFTFSFH